MAEENAKKYTEHFLPVNVGELSLVLTAERVTEIDNFLSRVPTPVYIQTLLGNVREQLHAYLQCHLLLVEAVRGMRARVESGQDTERARNILDRLKRLQSLPAQELLGQGEELRDLIALANELEG